MQLTNARWIISLLETHLKGETIQYSSTGKQWEDIDPGEFYGFNHKERYRIKPRVAEYRLYGYVKGPQGIYCAERNTLSQNARSHLAPSPH